MRQTWKYEMEDGTKGRVTTVPVDIVMAEKATKTLVSQGVGFQFMTTAVHNALMREARKSGGILKPYNEWLESLVSMEDANLEAAEEDLSPFDGNGISNNPRPSVSAY